MKLEGRGKCLEIDPQGRAYIIAERINPSGREDLRQQLLDGKFDLAIAEAKCQVAAGADIIDINVGGKGVDETAVLAMVVAAVSDAVEVPLCIDTRVPEALKKALEVCPGRPLVNSISAEKKVLVEILPIVAAYELPVVALCMGQDGIPPDVDGRLRNAEHCLEAAIRLGIKEEDVVFDPLVMTVGANDHAGVVVLETIERLRASFPKNSITGGASNISYGMPQRRALDASFLAVAFSMGMNMPITDPTNANLIYALLSTNIFLGRDRKSKHFMRSYRSLRALLNSE